MNQLCLFPAPSSGYGDCIEQLGKPLPPISLCPLRAAQCLPLGPGLSITVNGRDSRLELVVGARLPLSDALWLLPVLLLGEA